MFGKRIDRRGFLRICGLSAFGLSAPGPLVSAFRSIGPPERKLSFYNIHTRESLNVVYVVDGCPDPGALAEINQILRDHRTGDVFSIDCGLLDLLYALKLKLKTGSSFHVISGYRSPVTNAMLRDKSTGVAKNSLHMIGKAIDIRVPGTQLRKLQKTAVDLCAGGVGYYAKSNFVHVDTGPVRSW